MIGPPPVCVRCVHYRGGSEAGLTCAAFPEGIPQSVIIEGNDHREPIVGDHGIRFAPRPGEA